MDKKSHFQFRLLCQISYSFYEIINNLFTFKQANNLNNSVKLCKTFVNILK